jgi:hypothetical protein
MTKRSLAFLLCAGLVFGAFFHAEAASDPVSVVSLAGEVKVTPAGAAKPVACEPKMFLQSGDRIKTGRESYLEIAFDRRRENIVRIEEKSDVVLRLADGEKIELVDGRIFTVLKNLKSGEVFRVRTPCAVCGARGTGWQTKTTGEETDVSVFDGRVLARGIKKDGSAMEREHWIDEGFERKIKKHEKPGDMTKVPDKKIAEWRKKFGIKPKLKARIWQARIKGMDNGFSKNQDRVEQLMARKSDARLDKLREKDDEKGGYEQKAEIR